MAGKAHSVILSSLVGSGCCSQGNLLLKAIGGPKGIAGNPVGTKSLGLPNQVNIPAMLRL